MAKMAEFENSELDSSHGTPKLQLFTEQLLLRKTRRVQKRSSTTKDIKKET